MLRQVILRSKGRFIGKPALALLRQGQVLLKKQSAHRKPALALLRQGQVLLKKQSAHRKPALALEAGTGPTAEAIGTS